jgi:hypothetical protein
MIFKSCNHRFHFQHEMAHFKYAPIIPITDISNTAHSTDEPSLFLCRQVCTAYQHYCYK